MVYVHIMFFNIYHCCIIFIDGLGVDCHVLHFPIIFSGLPILVET